MIICAHCFRTCETVYQSRQSGLSYCSRRCFEKGQAWMRYKEEHDQRKRLEKARKIIRRELDAYSKS